MSDLSISIRLTADGRELRGTMQASQEDVNRLRGRLEESGQAAERSGRQTERYGRQAQQAGRQSQTLRERVQRLTGSFFNLNSILAVVSVAAITRSINAQIAYADQVDKTSQRIGVSTRALQEYMHVAEMASVETNTLTAAWQRQTRRIAEAVQGTGIAVDALDRLGLSAQRLNQLAPDQQFEVLAEALRGVANEGERVALAQRFWDREGVSLLQIINQTSDAIDEQREEAHRLGRVMSEDTVQAFVAAGDAKTRLNAAMQGLTLTLLNDLAPALEAIANTLAELIPRAVRAAMENFMSFRLLIKDIAAQIVEEWAWLFNQLGRLPDVLGGQRFREQGERLTETWRRLQDEAAEYNNRLVDFIREGSVRDKRSYSFDSK